MMQLLNKDLNKRADSDKVLRDKAFNFAKNPKYDGYHCGIASIVYTFFDKKTPDRKVKNENFFGKELPK